MLNEDLYDEKSDSLYNFFMQFTQETAQKYGLVGWVKNTSDGTVTGTVQGPEDKVKAMYVKWMFHFVVYFINIFYKKITVL